MASALERLPAKPKDRFEVYRVFDGLADEGKSGLDSGRTSIPLVKTFLIEHVSHDRGGNQVKPLADLWNCLGATPQSIDDTFYAVSGVVTDPETRKQTTRTTGYVEQYDERFFAYYTVEDSLSARKRVHNWVTRSAELDRTWFSSPLLKSIWDHHISTIGDHRFTELDFRHEGKFETIEQDDDESEGPQPSDDLSAPDDDDSPSAVVAPERRKISSKMSDHVGRLRNSLSDLRESYSPFHALYRLRIPSQTGRGGHDINQEGQLTNRSESFLDHRNHARFLWRLYRQVLQDTEASAWGDVGPGDAKRPVGWQGVPLIVNFADPLPEATFHKWVEQALRKGNSFHLWGEPIWRGPTRVHIYGADRHLWQPLNLELTESRLVAILPRGTCGNTFHRLIANVQQYVAPKIEAWIGARRFDSLAGADSFTALEP